VIVRRRIRDVGGTLDIAMDEGGGTRVRAVVPIERIDPERRAGVLDHR
jgi:hypothetical protein